MYQMHLGVSWGGGGGGVVGGCVGRWGCWLTRMFDVSLVELMLNIS